MSCGATSSRRPLSLGRLNDTRLQAIVLPRMLVEQQLDLHMLASIDAEGVAHPP